MAISDHLAQADTLLVDKLEAASQTSLASWRTPAVLVSLACLTITALLWQTAFSIGKTWYSSRTFSHGFLIIPMFLYLMWVRRNRLRVVTWKPSYWALPVLGLLVMLWGLGNLGDVRVVEQFALVGIVVTTIWAMLGTEVVRALRFPLLFLFFAVPFGESAIGPLQDLTAFFAVAGLRLSQIPVILDYRTISIPSGTWVVEEACSGIRYLFSTIVLGLIYASFVYQSTKRRALFLLACAVVPILANGIRAYGIIMLAHLTNNRLAVGVDHIVYGWVLLTIVQLGLFFVGFRWAETGPSNTNIERAEIRRRTQPVLAMSLIAICAVGFVTTARAASAYLAKREVSQSAAEAKLVVQAPWRPALFLDAGWTPKLHPSAELTTSYTSNSEKVDVYVATYSGQQPVELVGGYNQVLQPNLWSLLSSGTVKATVNHRSIPVNWSLLQTPQGRSRMVWSWYDIAGETTASRREVKFLRAKQRLLGKPAVNAYVAVSAEYVLDASQASEAIQDLLNHATLQAVLAPSREY